MAKKQNDADKAAATAPAADSNSMENSQAAAASVSAPVPRISNNAASVGNDDKVSQSDAEASAPADPAPATELDQPSGAIIEPELARAVDVSHESVDANPRAGTTSEQNAIDWNDAKRRRPGDSDFAGQGLDETVYGKGAKA